MGFKANTYATVWGTPKAISKSMANVQISISVKDKETGTYNTEFSNFVTFVGGQCASAALQLKEGDRIVLGNVDCLTHYDKERQTKYYNYKVFGFKLADSDKTFGFGNFGTGNGKSKDGGYSKSKAKPAKKPEPEPVEEDDLTLDRDDLPF